MRTTVEAGTSSSPGVGEAECFMVAGELVAEYWDKLRPLVDRWVRENPGYFTAGDIFFATLGQKIQIFCIHFGGEISMIFFTEFLQFPAMKVLRVLGICGDRPLLLPQFVPALESWAKANGAGCLESFATPRAEKLVQRCGFKPVLRLMRRMITDD